MKTRVISVGLQLCIPPAVYAGLKWKLVLAVLADKPKKQRKTYCCASRPDGEVEQSVLLLSDVAKALQRRRGVAINRCLTEAFAILKSG